MADENTTEDTEKSGSGLDIDWLRTIAGALAAITTAVLLSTLGAAGTLLGAALGSIAATVGTAVYSQGLARSKARLAAVQEQALGKVGVAQAEVRRSARRGDTSRLPQAEEHLAEAADMLDPSVEGAPGDELAGPAPTWRERLAVLPWKRIALVAAGLFVLVMVVISAFEALTGKPVSSYTGGSDSDGGTSITRITGGGSSDEDGDKDRGPKQGEPSDGTRPSDGTTPSGQPTDGPSGGTSSETPEMDPRDEEPEQSPSPEPTPEAPTPSAEPSAPAPSPTTTP
ncbi:hypothetical protein [Nocardioides marmotae]|uniref:Uncharacterized protein n=1 Tax=Nocardioides marmotae TaxID=2663857 RepID=A0A6I3J165_9ACTN|nr:hypothetical protein [Nocardioides marmotae]MCR6030362.1 hypothetical protein [Gordonia jinghuaiqii]MBC9734355.1 hypothetical protein [Nocardioides marmotae]MTB85454.1 hypothetical protein [Nocardioides marmotae]MTB93996.1 hypothetical protein [Nocardioides marmotae]QKE00311.1 hypothetical protein HPC71_03850 [Nocardioides marmotae]